MPSMATHPDYEAAARVFMVAGASIYAFLPGTSILTLNFLIVCSLIRRHNRYKTMTSVATDRTQGWF